MTRLKSKRRIVLIWPSAMPLQYPSDTSMTYFDGKAACCAVQSRQIHQSCPFVRVHLGSADALLSPTDELLPHPNPTKQNPVPPLLMHSTIFLA